MKFVPVALAALLLAACGSVEEPTGTQSPSTPAGTSPTPTATPPPVPPPKPTPKPRPAPHAKDGRNLSACADGDCQVLVRSGQKIKFRGSTLAITVAGDTATFALTGAIRGGSGTLTADPHTFGDTVVIGAIQPRSDDPPGVTLRAPYAGDNQAIIDIHLVP
ncbi:hypothetical protein AB0E69_26570 [Kribbella sp. NPDC026611]|uniref:hypothetical protein n=1 Tax=Kribbella sp. NPDC026611 TaxID=3154911 RepID=UPI0033C59521